jgi:signal peptidase I
MSPSHHTIACVIATSLLSLAPGCSAGGHLGPSTYAAAQDSQSERRTSDWYNDDERDANSAHYDGIPSRARVATEGTGKIKYKATSAGRVYIGDDQRERQIVSVKVKRGDTITVEPDKDRIKKNDEVIFDRNLERNNPHTIFFVQDANATDPDDDADFGGGYDGIPTSAKRAKSGGGVLRYQATREGRVWVGDDDRERMILSKAVVKGDIVEVDPSKDQVRLNDEIIYDRDLVRRNDHSIFFRAEKNPGGGGSGGGTKPPTDPKPENPKPENPKPPKNDGAGSGSNKDKPTGITGGSGHPSQLKGASRVAKGKGTLTHTAKEDGQFWVYDPAEKKIVAAGTVKKGETITADPTNNSTTVPGGARNLENYVPSHEHEMYFKKS